MSRHRSPEAAAGDRLAREARLLGHAVPEALGAEILSRSEVATVFRVVGPDMSSLAVKIVPGDQLDHARAVYQRIGLQAGVLPLQDSGEVEGQGYLAFPFYPGTLADRIEAGPVPAAEAGRLLRAAADSVVALHLAGLVHGDIKPANLLLSPSDQAVLADLDGSADFGAVARRVTPGFCPPEQLQGAPLAFENDVYSFAATVLCLLSGGTAWMADPHGWLAGPLAGGLAPEVTELLAAGIARDPAARRVSPQQLVAALGPASAAWPAQGGSVIEPELAVPARQVISPSAIRPGEPAQTLLPAAATATVAVAPERDELADAAQQVWGFVDLRAATTDRLALQLQPPQPSLEPELAERSVWRHPAMIASLVLAAALVLFCAIWLLL
ncbi:MAG TPA: hypothetical protein VHO01_16085 [Jatrophihabitans sp.]|nr:hypothetical protein [Jatrophihabitans sp.]